MLYDIDININIDRSDQQTHTEQVKCKSRDLSWLGSISIEKSTHTFGPGVK